MKGDGFSFLPPYSFLPNPPVTSAKGLIQSESRLRDWLDVLETRLEKLSVAYNSASFNRYIGHPVGDISDLHDSMLALLTDPAYQSTVQSWLSRPIAPDLHRRLVLFARASLESQVSLQPALYELRNRLNERLLTFRPGLPQASPLAPLATSNQTSNPGSRSELNRLLRCHPDRSYRQNLYLHALQPLSVELAPQVAHLMELRNAEARRLGYATYAQMHLALLGFERTELLALFARLEDLTANAYKTFLNEARQEWGWDKVQPWDLQWLAERRAGLPDEPFRREKQIGLVNALLAEFGLDPARLPIQFISQDIPYGGLCFTIRVPDDMRIVGKLSDGYASFRTLVHEFGHGLHGAFNGQSTYLLKREWGPFNEGMAEILAYFTHHPEWLARTTGLPAAALAHYHQENNLRRILRLRNLMAQAHFEIEAYDNPATDLDKLLAEHESHYLKIPLDLTPRWAAVSFPTTHPLYRQNYLTAEMIAAQTHKQLRGQFGPFFQLDTAGRAAVFTFLQKNYYTSGATLDWPDKIRQATGQPLGLEALLEDLGL